MKAWPHSWRQPTKNTGSEGKNISATLRSTGPTMKKFTRQEKTVHSFFQIGTTRPPLIAHWFTTKAHMSYTCYAKRWVNELFGEASGITREAILASPSRVAIFREQCKRSVEKI